MRVTIITVAKNAEATITDCLKSVNNQTYANIEHIIVDGKSTDNTLKLIGAFVTTKDYKIISENDLGIYDALNKGIALSTGDVIGLLHSDDFFQSNFTVQQIVDGFNQFSTPILFAKVTYVDRKYINIIKRVYSSPNFKPWVFRFGFAPAHPTFYVKKEIFEKYGLYRTDLEIAGDFDLMLRFIYKFKIPYTYINQCWVNMRLGGLSTSGISSMLQNNKEILQACKDNKIYSNYLLLYSKYFIKCLEWFRRE
jgi:glycosyltransferase involved in cell wall biosynthesis